MVTVGPTFPSSSLVTRDAGDGEATTSAPSSTRDGSNTARGSATSTPGGPLVRVQRPHGAVVHLYGGVLTPSGRRVPRGARAVCNTLTGVLWVEGTWGALDPDSRRLCRRCAVVAVSEASSPGTGPAPRSRDDWASFAAGLAPIDLAMAAVAAETPAEVWRVELLALLAFGPAAIHSTMVRFLGHVKPLWVWVDQARTRVGCQDDFAERQEAILREARSDAEIRRRSRFQQSKREDAAEDQRAGRYVPSWQRPA